MRTKKSFWRALRINFVFFFRFATPLSTLLFSLFLLAYIYMVCGTAFAPQKSVELFFSVFFFSFPLVRPKKHTQKKTKKKQWQRFKKKKNKINNTHANKKTDESQTGQISPLNIVSIVFSVSFFFFFFFFLFDYIYIYIFSSIVIALKEKKKKLHRKSDES